MWSLHVLPVFPWVGGILPSQKHALILGAKYPPLASRGAWWGLEGSGWNNVILPRDMSGWGSSPLWCEKKRSVWGLNCSFCKKRLNALSLHSTVYWETCRIQTANNELHYTVGEKNRLLLVSYSKIVRCCHLVVCAKHCSQYFNSNRKLNKHL